MSNALMLANPSDLGVTRPYAERAELEPGWPDRLARFLYASTIAPVRGRLQVSTRRLSRIVELAAQHEHLLRSVSDRDIRQRAHAMRARMRREGFTPALVGECFAMVREAASRTTGQRHFESQLMGGWALLEGQLVEMATGEGKTVTATLPACTVALAGYPVHVITVNDYLAERDAAETSPLYHFFGLTVGTVVQGMPRPARRDAYSKSITYCTNKELAFDYLRDGVALQSRSKLHLALESLRGDTSRDDGTVLRGLYYCIVDEADSVFVDEARTPLILSAGARSTEEANYCTAALAFARNLKSELDFRLDSFERSVTLTDDGKSRLDAFAIDMKGPWTSGRVREELVMQALSALLLYRVDQQYVVSDGKVKIVDESTGRVMPDRSWERGLHQMIEMKEGCDLTERRETLARMTYQRLFRRYLRLAGMTGTGSEVAREIKSVYDLDVVKIPLHKPAQRVYLKAQVCLTLSEKWEKVADSVARLAHAGGQPVLIGTRSVKASEEISAVLSARGIDHALLNAKQDEGEAEVIAMAGQAGRVTVATNMAGRGTDIKLGTGVAQKGGLHVILTEYHESRRIDRQLFGRCARQGDPGSCEAIVSLEDELFEVYAPGATRAARVLTGKSAVLPAAAYVGLKTLAQSASEGKNAQIRIQNMKHDRRLSQVLAFSGKAE